MKITVEGNQALSAARERALSDYGKLLRRRIIVLSALVLLLIAAVVCDIGAGASSISFPDILRALALSDGVDRSVSVIVWDVRLAPAVMAVFAGMALALAGAEMQTILNNPLASPFTLGVSSAASLGAALVIILGISVPYLPASWTIAGNAFLFALLSVFLLQSLTQLRGAGVESLVLFGIALVFTFNALVALVQFIASADALQQLVFWGMGSLSRATWDTIGILAVVIIATFPFAMRASWQLTALRLGEERAQSLGVDVKRLRFAALVRISLLAGTSVAFVGTIGFIGLVGPHIARLLIGEDHRFFLPASALSGALVMSLADIVSKVIVTGVIIPIGIVTSLVGLPIFFSLIFRKIGGRA